MDLKSNIILRLLKSNGLKLLFRILPKRKNIDKTKTDEDTDNIDSDDHNVTNRKRNFEILSRRLNNYLDKSMRLYKGNDLKYNTYIRKIDKLSKFGNIDIEGFKDYVDNIKKINQSENQSLKSKYLLNICYRDCREPCRRDINQPQEL